MWYYKGTLSIFRYLHIYINSYLHKHINTINRKDYENVKCKN